MEREPIEPMKLRNAEEKQCWIAVYAANSDNEEDSSDQLARWADAAVLRTTQAVPLGVQP